MRAPTTKPRSGEIVQEIVEKIQGEPSSEWDIGPTVAVQATIRLLKELDREVAHRRGALKERIPIRGKRQENDEDFNAVLKQLKGLQNALQKVSGPGRLLLFSEERDVNADGIPTYSGQQRHLRRIQQVMLTLATMRRRCEVLLKERPGEHGNTDYRQRRVAEEAWHLLGPYGKKPAGGTMDSLYGQIASLLWEAMTGEADKDLQRACKAALRLADEGGLREGSPVIGRGQISVS